MSSIEEDIKVLENLIVTLPNFHLGGSDNISRVLQDYTRQKQINEEHQRINGELREKVKELEEELEKANRQLDLDYVEENFIPKQAVKEKIEEIIIDKGNRYYDKFLESRDIQYTIDILREILEGGK